MWLKTQKNLAFKPPGSAFVIVVVLEMLDTLLLNIQKIEQEIRNLVKQETYIKDNLALLQSIPGIGPHSSVVILSEIGDFSLFQKPKQLAAYFGLPPHNGNLAASADLKTSYLNAARLLCALRSIWPRLPLSFHKSIILLQISFYILTMRKSASLSPERLLCAQSCIKSAILFLLFFATKSPLNCGCLSSTLKS